MAKGNVANAISQGYGGEDDTTGGMGTAGSTGVDPNDPTYQAQYDPNKKANVGQQQQSPLGQLAPQQFADAAPTWQQQLAKVGRAALGISSPNGIPGVKNVGPEQPQYNPMQENPDGGDFGRLNHPDSMLRKLGHNMANYGRMETNRGLTGRGPF